MCHVELRDSCNNELTIEEKLRKVFSKYENTVLNRETEQKVRWDIEQVVTNHLEHKGLCKEDLMLLSKAVSLSVEIS